MQMSLIYLIFGVVALLGTIFNFYQKKIIYGGVSLWIFGMCMYLYTLKPPQENLVVVVSPDYPPYCSIKNGQIVGIDISLLEDVAKLMNKKLEIKVMNFNFLFNHLHQKKSQIAAGGLSINTEREKNCHFSIPYIPALCGVVYKKNITLNSDFSGTIGVQAGSIFVEMIKNKFPRAKIMEMDDFLFLVEGFKSNKNQIDALVGDAVVLIEVFGHKSHDFYMKRISVSPTISHGTAFALSTTINLDAFNLNLSQAIKKNRKLNTLLSQVQSLEEL